MIRKLGLIAMVLVLLALLASGCTQQIVGNRTTTTTPTITVGVGGAAATVTTAAPVGNGATGSRDLVANVTTSKTV
jgi:hypothetical protein